MKRFIAVLSSLLVLPAFAEVAPTYYDEVIEYSEEEFSSPDAVADVVIEQEEETTSAPVVPSKASPRKTVSNSGRVASRALPSMANAKTNATTRGTSGRATPSTRNAVTTRSATTTVRSATPATRGTVSRASRAVSNATANGTGQIATTRRVMQNTGAANTARASITTTDTVTTSLYSGNRASTRTSAAVRARIPTISASTTTSTTESVSSASTTSADELAQITDFCKAQYTQCMDNYCNVLDDNQGRCSCSKNLKNYEKTEEALKAATEALQDVAQQIQYIGLTADQVNTLFTETEAEAIMSGTSDSTQLKNDLDKIKKMVVDVKSGSASTTVTSGLSMDLSGLLDFNISSTGFDLSALFGNSSDTTSISNQRGETLYKTATTRCKASVLNSCQAQGVDISIITNSYDLEIDKQCLIYERNLTETNDEMNSTVRNAKSVLQKARLMVAQQKNAYDLRGCINALDSCMQDDYVCGSDYEYCLDPSGKYIVNGEIVEGSTPGMAGRVLDTDNQIVTDGLYSAWNYKGSDTKDNNAWSSGGNVSDYVNTTVTSSYPTSGLNVMSVYLHNKIGQIVEGKAIGMCSSVLNQCQDYTFSDGAYVQDNQVIKNWLERVSIQIKSAQDTILSDYAEECLSDVVSCLASNGYDETQDATKTRNSIAMNACNSLITTCMSVNGVTGDNDMNTINRASWISFLMSDDDLAAENMAKFNACLSTGGSYTSKPDGTGDCTCDSTSGKRTQKNATTGECECASGTEWNGTSCENSQT